MIEAYRTGDPYVAFAKMAGLAPIDATAASHPTIREQCKRVMIAVTYGMGPQSLADRLGVTQVEARELLRLHRLTFPRFWRWIESTVSAAMITNKLTSVFGWQLNVGRDPNTLPTEGYVLEIDGKFKSEHKTSEAAMKAGLELKKKYPHIRVVVYGAEQRTRTPIELSEGSERETVPIS